MFDEFKCPKCNELVEPNDKYCPKHENELQEHAIDLFGREQWNNSIKNGTNPLTILKSAGSIRFAPSSCERCKKRFRFFRKERIVFDRVNERWLYVCNNCIKMTDAK